MEFSKRNHKMILDSFGPLEVAVYETVAVIAVAASFATMFRLLEHDDNVEEELKLENFEKIFNSNQQITL